MLVTLVTLADVILLMQDMRSMIVGTLGTSHRVERESFEAYDNNQLPRYILWQRLPLRDTTLGFHRNGQDNSPQAVIQNGTP